MRKYCATFWDKYFCVCFWAVVSHQLWQAAYRRKNLFLCRRLKLLSRVADFLSAARVVVHVDADTFFVQVERTRDPSLRGVPVAVQQHQDTIATSLECRALGIKKHTPPVEVRARFPQVRLVHVPTIAGKATYGPYRKAANQIWRAIADFCTPRTIVVERRGMDEGFLDVPLSCLGADSSTRGHGAFSAAAALAEELRRHVLAATGYILSAGVSFSKLFAKLASRRAKPDGVFVISQTDAAALLPGLSVDEIPGCGGDVAAALAARGIRTCGEAQALSLADLQSILPGGRRAEQLFKLCRGEDDAPVVASGPPKSVQSQASLTPLVLWDRSQPATSAGTVPAASVGSAAAVTPGGSLPPAHDLMEPTAPWQLGRLRRMLLTLAADLVQRVEEDGGEHGRHPTSLGCSVQLYTCSGEDIHREIGKARLLATGARAGGAGEAAAGGAGAGSSASASASAAGQSVVHASMLVDGSIVHWPVPERVLALCPPASAHDMEAAGLSAGSSSNSSGSTAAALPEIRWTKPAADLRRGPGQIATRSCAFPVEAATAPPVAAAARDGAAGKSATGSASGSPDFGAESEFALNDSDPRVLACLEAATRLYVAAVKAAAAADGWAWNDVTILAAPAVAADSAGDADGTRATAAVAAAAPPDKAALAKQRINSFTLPLAVVKIALIATGFQAGPVSAGIKSFFAASAGGMPPAGTGKGLGVAGPARKPHDVAATKSASVASPLGNRADGRAPAVDEVHAVGSAAKRQRTDSVDHAELTSASIVHIDDTSPSQSTCPPSDPSSEALRQSAEAAQLALVTGRSVKLSGLLSMDILRMRSLE